jgi:hypothetical protein
MPDGFYDRPLKSACSIAAAMVAAQNDVEISAVAFKFLLRRIRSGDNHQPAITTFGYLANSVGE